jgi:tRNA-specific 2-thiouridylase
MSQRVLVAMSGGVDSSVAAALLQAEGYDIVGVTLHLWDYPDDGSTKGRCCAPEDVHDARRVADLLGFPHYAFDRRELFEREVVTPFVESYLAGETPSPCVRCNRGVKLRELVALADRLDAPFLATGHYARILRTASGPELLAAKDLGKDQSYFLHMLPASTLERLMFPLGELDKAAVRRRAAELNLPGAHKGESQELCFVPTGRYDELVQARAPDRLRPGPIVGQDGRVLGQHAGVHRFTLGQRRNLGVAAGERAYVVDIDAETHAVHLGKKEDLLATSFEVEDLVLQAGVTLPLAAQVVVRYRGHRTAARATASSQAGRVTVNLDEPVVAPTAGQYAVFYDGQRVLGGGAIIATRGQAGKAEHAHARG